MEDVCFKTHRRGWLLFRTRYLVNPDPSRPPDVLPKWSELIQADMTWEGYFRVAALPSETQSLIGTYGSNHDTDLFAIGSDRRRRHSAVWLDPSGRVSFNTNVGTSSGGIEGPNVPVADGKWHHVAAVFQKSGAGARVTFSMKVDKVEFGQLEPLQLIQPFSDSVARVVAVAADTTTDHISMTLEEGQIFMLRAVWAHISINVRTDKAEEMRDRLTIVPWLGDSVAKEVMYHTPRIWNAIPTGLDTIVVTSRITLPLVQSAGSARLYVDGFPGVGTLTYVPEADNIAMDGQLVVGGGHRGRAFDCEVSRFRVWGVALAAAQIQELRACTLPSLPSLVGGPWPHGLRADYPLNGTYADSMDTGFSALESDGGGQFAIGGHCSIDSCPAHSSASCPHVADREVRFPSAEQCGAFARYVHCTVAGGNRGRPPELTGCGAPVL